jgi:methionyl-tRNA formyltransferase
MEIRIAHFGIHKLLSDTLENLASKKILPAVVIFPPIESVYHQKAEEICSRFHIPVLIPGSVKDLALIQELQHLQINRIVVTGYPQIFPQSLLDLATEGAINCHGGLLPEEKGPVPWKWAVYESRPYTGVTFHRMTAKVDQGEILLKIKIPLVESETSETLFNKIAEVITSTASDFYKMEIPERYNSKEWEVEKVVYHGHIPEELCLFDLKLPAAELEKRVRAFSPRPGVFFTRTGQNILVKEVEIEPKKTVGSTLILKSADLEIAITDFEIVGN